MSITYTCDVCGKETSENEKYAIPLDKKSLKKMARAADSVGMSVHSAYVGLDISFYGSGDRPHVCGGCQKEIIRASIVCWGNAPVGA